MKVPDVDCLMVNTRIQFHFKSADETRVDDQVLLRPVLPLPMQFLFMSSSLFQLGFYDLFLDPVHALTDATT